MKTNRLLIASHKTIFLTIMLLVLTSCTLPEMLTLRDPLTPEEHINLGIAYESHNELDKALKEYKVAAKRSPIAYLYMGNIYFQKNAVDDAERCYKKAIKKTNDPRAYNNLAWLYYSEDMKLNDAEEYACRAVELSPDSQDFKDTLETIVEKKAEMQRRGI